MYINDKEETLLRIKSIRLINFSSIFACRNLKEVYYEFNSNGKTINQICGPNRSGKTVLIQQLHPFSSINLSGDERSDLQLIIPGETGVKEIIYEVDDKEYVINHTYKPTGKSHSVISSLTCNGSELNSSGGVNTFNSLIEKIFGLNRYTFQFTINGTQLNSLSNMNATQRKTLLNKALGVDIYDKIHKLATADHRYVSKTITSLNNTKEFVLKKYGSYEVLQKMLSEKQNEVDSVDKELFKLKTEMDILQGSIIAIEEQHPYEELSRHEEIMQNILLVSEQIGSYDDKTYMRLSDESIELNKQLEQIKSKYQMLIMEADNYEEKKDNINSTMMKSKQMKDDYDNMIAMKKRLEYDISCINTNRVLSSSSEYYRNQMTLAQTINSISREISSTLNDNLLSMIVDMMVNHLDIPSFLVQETAKLMDGEKEKQSMNRLNSILSNVQGDIPNCDNDNCLYRNIYDRLQVYFKSYQATSNSKITLDDLENIDHCWKNITSIKRLINNEYPEELKNVFNIDNIMLNIKQSKWGIDIDYMKSLYEDAVHNEERISLIQRLENVKSSISTIESVMVDTEDPTSAINDINEKLRKINEQRESLLRERNELESKLLINDKHRGIVSRLNGVHVGDVRGIISKLKETIERLHNLQNKQSEMRDKYNQLSINQSNLRRELESLQTDDTQCKQTMNELISNKDKDNQYKMISDATSSTKGLPVVMIHNTLEESIKIANHLLNVIYEGSVHLNEVEISESALNIPFTHDLITSNDIRYGSQSESTIFALVLALALTTQLTNYNIILIDEIDAYLDHEFKDKFILMLDEVSKLLKFDQLFVISHNINTDQFENIINKISLI